jgi:hypothetical protein
MISWEVDGVNHLFQQWFWQRVGGGAEAELGALGLTSATPTGSNILDLVYGPAVGGLQVSITYILTGGPSGSGTSGISEVITLKNTSSVAMDLHFFQYTDFDLGGVLDAFDDVARFTTAIAGNEIEQFDPDTNFSEVITTPAAGLHQISAFPAIHSSLTDGGPTTLTDTPAPGVLFGPADVEFAFRWDFTLAAGDETLISKTKRVRGVIPEPASLAIWGLGALSLSAFGLRRRRS